MIPATAFFRIACSAVAIVAIAAPVSAEAQPGIFRLDVPAQDLGTALKAIAGATGQQVVFKGKSVRGKRSNAVRGSLTPDDAVAIAIRGSGLAASRSARGVIIVAPAARAVASQPASRPAGNSGARATAAQTDAAAPAAPEETAQAVPKDIVVTGTRLQSGFTTATPVTTTPAQDLLQAAPNNLADGLGLLPVFAGNTQTGVPESTANTGSGGANGQNLLNMRGLGAKRNLVLLDGRRLPATNSSGSVDINILPQGLVSRVDVVTGGASAAYGSDAIAGVINFVLDTRFEGLKGRAQAGISTYGDLPSRGASLAFGRSFADQRIRLILSADYFRQDGIRADEPTGRDWFDFASGRIDNPSGGAPTEIIVPNLRSGVGTYGGLITRGPLANTQFLPGGASAPFVPAAVCSGNFCSGGDGGAVNLGFSPDQERYSLFGHTEFDLGDRLMVFAEGAYASSHVVSGNFAGLHIGTSNQYTIYRDNAFLPADVLQRMITSNVQSFNMGRFERDMGLVEIETKTRLTRGTVGVKGSLSDDLNWDAYFNYARLNQELRENNMSISHNLYAAVDAVRDPATGNIVCRSTLMGYDPGCVPINLFGEGSPSAAAIDYVNGDSIRLLTQTQKVGAINLRGNLGSGFQLGAGPVSFAVGAEYREEKVNATSDPISQSIVTFPGIRGFPSSLQNKLGGFQYFNPLPLGGSYTVKEAYAEIGVPLLRDVPLANLLSVNGAVRYAHHSLSGPATAWKLGAIYEPFRDLRLRFTASRDIRGANTVELFNSSTSSSNNTSFKGQSYASVTISSGNIDLDPEISKTITGGFIYKPAWIPGLQFSVDYYRIKIHGAIGLIQRIPTQCESGNQIACSLITITPQNTLIIRSQVTNLSLVENEGIDFELAYRRPLFAGDLAVRLLANRGLTDETTNPGGTPRSSLGNAATPKWRALLQATYSQDAWSIFVQERFISAAQIDVRLVEGVDIDRNAINPFLYTTVGANYKLKLLGGDQQIFFNVNNVFNTSPPVAPESPTSFNGVPTDSIYDRYGRYFVGGVRFEW